MALLSPTLHAKRKDSSQDLAWVSVGEITSGETVGGRERSRLEAGRTLILFHAYGANCLLSEGTPRNEKICAPKALSASEHLFIDPSVGC